MMCASKKQLSILDDGNDAGQRRQPSVTIAPKASPIVSGDSKAQQNIVVLGPTGGGASSVVNLIIGKEVAPVSNDTQRRTTEATAYPIELESAGGVIQSTLHDVPSFNSSPPALSSGGISLAIVCMEDRTPQVKEAICYLDDWANQHSCNVPVLVVINHMTPCPDPNWWETNKGHFAKLRLVAGHACLTRKEKLQNTEELRSLIIELLFRHA